MINVGNITKVKTVDLYESLVATKSFSWFEDEVQLVRFYLYRPNECDNVHSVVKEIDLHHGASFIGDDTIDMDTIAEMIDLLSDYVYLNPSPQSYLLIQYQFS